MQNAAFSLVSHWSIPSSDWLILLLGLPLTNHVHTALTTGYRDRLVPLLPAAGRGLLVWQLGPQPGPPHAHWVPNYPCQDIKPTFTYFPLAHPEPLINQDLPKVCRLVYTLIKASK